MATSFISLPLIPRPFAQGGSRADIPNSVDAGSNRASWTKGWDTITSTPIAQGGIPANRLDFNGVLNALSKYAYTLQEGRYWTFDQSFCNVIGGYPKGALLWQVVDGSPRMLVMSRTNNNTDSNLNNVTNWLPMFIRPYGGAQMDTYYNDIYTQQIRNVALVTEEPSTGKNGTIYMVIEE